MDSLGTIEIVKIFINYILGVAAMIAIIGTPIGIVILINLHNKKQVGFIKTRSDIENGITAVYSDFFDIKDLPENQRSILMNNGFYQPIRRGVIVFLNILTLGFFSCIYYGIQFNFLPRITKKDFGSGKAIGYLFIPLFNIYRVFIFWLRLADRINFQFRLRNKSDQISRGLIIAMLIINLIPYINFISIFVLQSIVIYQIQSATNYLARENLTKNNK